MRVHLFEFEDFSWFPDPIREGGTDYLRYFLNTVGFYKPVIPLLKECLETTNENRIVDLCSGGGGPIEQIYKDLNAHSEKKITITLSDKFPNTKAYSYVKEKSNGQVDFKEFSIDATTVPPDLIGFRTMFSAVHHFDKKTIKAVLKNSVDHNAGIALFDGGDKNIFVILGIILFHPLAFLVATPFFKPFRFSRIFFTYIIPFIPFTTVWDGCISILRLYSPEELLNLAKETEPEKYTWRSGKIKNKLGMNVAYLIGYPNKDYKK